MSRCCAARSAGAAAMRAQLEHLLDVGRRRHVALRVLPASVGAHAGLEGAFKVFEMPRPYPAVAYMENLGGKLYVEAPNTDRFVQAYDRLRRAALAAAESAAVIARIAEEFG